MTAEKKDQEEEEEPEDAEAKPQASLKPAEEWGRSPEDPHARYESSFENCDSIFECRAGGKEANVARELWIPLSPFRILADMFHFLGFRPVGQLIVPSSIINNIIILKTGYEKIPLVKMGQTNIPLQGKVPCPKQTSFGISEKTFVAGRRKWSSSWEIISEPGFRD